MRSARRMRLRFDDASGTLKLTCPARVSRAKALAWALDQRHWIETQLERAEPARPFTDGAVIPLEGTDTRIVWDASASRVPQLTDGVIRCGGPNEGLERRIERFLKRRALDVMTQDVAHYAAIAGVRVASVAIGDAASRWGSCSSQRRIRLSWRLILAPPAVRRYVAAHEVAHLVHLDHGPAFKALEARLYGPGLAQARSALRQLGPRLRAVGRR